MSFVTTLPAPITQCLPICTPEVMTVFAPIQDSSSMITGEVVMPCFTIGLEISSYVWLSPDIVMF